MTGMFAAKKEDEPAPEEKPVPEKNIVNTTEAQP